MTEIARFWRLKDVLFLKGTVNTETRKVSLFPRPEPINGKKTDGVISGEIFNSSSLVSSETGSPMSSK